MLALPTVLTPSPFRIYLITEVLQHGFRRTLPAIFAPAITDGPIILLVVLILSRMPQWMLGALRFGGGLYLLYLATNVVRLLRRTTGPTLRASGGQSAPKPGPRRRRQRAQPESLHLLDCGRRPHPHAWAGAISGDRPGLSAWLLRRLLRRRDHRHLAIFRCRADQPGHRTGCCSASRRWGWPSSASCRSGAAPAPWRAYRPAQVGERARQERHERHERRD